MKRTCSLLPYEVRLGVTGHRDLVGGGDAVRQSVAETLRRIETCLAPGGSTPLHWTVISPLAYGADRIVAEEVREKPGGRLEVITPFALDEYRKDFKDPDDRKAFEHLLATRDHLLELDAQPTNPDERNDGYLRCGETVVERSEIVIAVWNGERGEPGGVTEVIESALKRERVIVWIHSVHPGEPARLIRSVTRDSGRLKIETDDFPHRAALLSEGYAQQKAYCSDPALTEARYEDTVAKARVHLIKAAQRSGVPAEALKPLDAVLREHVRADMLAVRYQRRQVFVIAGILYLAAAAVTIGIAQVLFSSDNEKPIWLEVLAMLAVFVLWWQSRRGRWHERWLHDRYLAERLRTAIYTTLVAAVSADDDAIEDPLPFYRGPHHWMTAAVRTLCRNAASNLPSIPLAAIKQFVLCAWVEDQLHHHIENAKEKKRRAHDGHRLGLLLFLMTLIMAVLHACDAAPHSTLLSSCIAFLALAAPAWAGAVHATTAQLELERVGERSARMAVVIGDLAHRLARARNDEEVRKAVRQAADLMAIENHEWWVLLRFQDVRLQA